LLSHVWSMDKWKRHKTQKYSPCTKIICSQCTIYFWKSIAHHTASHQPIIFSGYKAGIPSCMSTCCIHLIISGNPSNETGSHTMASVGFSQAWWCHMILQIPLIYFSPMWVSSMTHRWGHTASVSAPSPPSRSRWRRAIREVQSINEIVCNVELWLNQNSCNFTASSSMEHRMPLYYL